MHAESHVDDHGSVYYDQRPSDDEYRGALLNLYHAAHDFAAWYDTKRPIHVAVDNATSVYNAASFVLDLDDRAAVDVGVDSARDGVSGPADNTLRRLRDEFIDALADALADYYDDAPFNSGWPVSVAARRYIAARNRGR